MRKGILLVFNRLERQAAFLRKFLRVEGGIHQHVAKKVDSLPGFFGKKAGGKKISTNYPPTGQNTTKR